MFAFQSNTIGFGYFKLKALSQSTIDPRVTFVDESGNERKVPVPSSIARRLSQKVNKVSRFTVDFPCCVATLDGRVVSVDVPTAVEFANWKKTGAWASPIEKNIEVVKKLNAADWLFDGQYAYRHDGPLVEVHGSNFAYQPVKAYNLYKMDVGQTLDEISLSCLAYKLDDQGNWQVTCPVTRASGGFLQLTGDVDTFNAGDQFVDNAVASSLTLMDNNHIVNLKFVNYAARRVSDCFGYAAAEPLGLPLLMIEHQTMSLINLPQSVQQTSPAPFKFTQGVAWVIGLFGRVQTLDQLMTMKATMKMLLTKGNTQVESSGDDVGDIPLKQKIAEMRARAAQAESINFEKVTPSSAPLIKFNK